MRLIDADALIGFLDVGHLRHPSELCFSEVDVANLLLHAPTISPDEVRGVGEWIGEGDGYADGFMVYDMWSCSCCGEYFDEWDDRPKWKFCPNCGARMKGTEENHTMDEFMYGQEMGSHSDGSL